MMAWFGYLNKIRVLFEWMLNVLPVKIKTASYVIIVLYLHSASISI